MGSFSDLAARRFVRGRLTARMGWGTVAGMSLSPMLDDDHYCYCCGPANPEGLHVHFDELPQGALGTRVVFAPHHAARGAQVHPGFLTLLVDELAVQMLLYQGIAAVSTELRMRTLEPVAVGEPVRARAWRGRSRGRFLEVECEARAGDGEGRVVAAGTIACMQVAIAADGGVERFVANRRNTAGGAAEGTGGETA